ncbi:IS5 family transposase [Streptomyces sp. NPDC058955]|uniref:IS5 family transposase n=1 Tax=unclassified Streptomyces TaxID=2593676 RepID=UPI00365DE69C
MRPPRPYPSDLSDARWELIRPTLETWRQARAGIRRPHHDLRALMNAILYVDRTGIPWRYLPHDFPPWQSVYGYFAHWQNDGIFDQLNGLLRGLLRQAEGREPEPTACLLDSQSIKTSANVHLADQGIDPAKKIIGRKRHIATDTLGLLLTVLVTAASVHDSAAGTRLIDDIAARHPTITKAWADNGYKNKAIEHAATRGIDLEIVQRDPHTRGFTVQPRRWVVERTLGWLMHHRRLARDYETHPHRSAAMIQIAAINLMTRRLTQQNTPNWRDT